MSVDQLGAVFSRSRWHKALTLHERTTSLSTSRQHQSDQNTDSETARKRLERWRSLPSFAVGEHFARRLELSRLTEQDLLQLLSETSESLSERATDRLGWLDEMELAFSGGFDHSTQPAIPAQDDSNAKKATEVNGILSIALPLIIQARKRLHEDLKDLQQSRASLPFDPATAVNLLQQDLLFHLWAQCNRTMVLELNVARLEGLLEGETPEQRFESFSGRLRNREVALAIFQEYPVLARQLVTCIDHWVNNSRDFLTRLCDDWEAIKSSFNADNNPGLLSRISGGAGDKHRQGQCVLLLTFESGFRLVYKPRSLAIDVHYKQLLEWMNERGAQPSFKTAGALDRGKYGWCEFVASRGCSSEAELQRFYQRQGGYLALLYLLEASDFHMENLIASGEHPVMVDLEALFHPRARTHVAGAALPLVRNIMSHSVLRVGLLPQKIWSVDQEAGVDLSGLGGVDGQLTPFPVLAYEKMNTDEMRVIRKRLEMSGSQNRPTLGHKNVNALNYSDEIISGFTSIYRLLLEYRDEFGSVDGPLAKFAEDEVRAVLRPTVLYARLLEESYHPDMLRDALDRDCLLDRMWSNVDLDSKMARVVPAEIKDLQQGDIPFFSARPNSCCVWTSCGEAIPEFFEESSLSLVESRLTTLSEDDLSRQIWFINASMASLRVGLNKDGLGCVSPGGSTTFASRERLLSGARLIADRLETLAIHDEGTVNWIGLTFVGERSWTLLPLGMDLYNGVLGPALFLAYLGDVTNEQRYTKLARTVLGNMLKIVAEPRSEFMSRFKVGAFSELGGLIYTLTHAGALWNDLEILAAADALVESLDVLIEQDETLDIINGSAGCIGALLALYRCTRSPGAFGRAIRCAEHLLSRACDMNQGKAWKTTAEAAAPLTGFSHGAAGIAWALLEVAAVTGDERYRRVAWDAIAYERSVFSSSELNWPDFRNDRTTENKSENNPEDVNLLSFACTWCHGAPGIGLARLRALNYSDDDALHEEVRIAIDTTRRNGFGVNHSICHGDLGNVELIQQAGQRFSDPALIEEANTIVGQVLDSIEKFGWLCGTPRAVETPGLMTGLAGIGYALLRFAEPERIPSVLILDPPKIELSSTPRCPSAATGVAV